MSCSRSGKGSPKLSLKCTVLTPMGTTLSHVRSLHGIHRPPAAHRSLLFDPIDPATQVDATDACKKQQWHELVCCPSRHGAHIICGPDSTLLYKVKTHLTHGEHSPRFDLYDLDDMGKARPTSIGHLEKVHTQLFAERGRFEMIQSWHVSCTKLDMKGLPGQALSINVSFELKGERNFKMKAETWSRKFAFSLPEYTMCADVDGISTPKKNVVRFYENGKCVCTGRLQTFEHLGIRGGHERPFVGVQLLAGTDLPRSSTTQRKAGRIRSDKPGHDPTDILPLLVILAWAEEALHVPADLRDNFMRRMRSKNKMKTEKWESDEVCINDLSPQKVAESIQIDEILGNMGVEDIIKEKQEAFVEKQRRTKSRLSITPDL